MVVSELKRRMSPVHMLATEEERVGVAPGGGVSEPGELGGVEGFGEVEGT
jgi:hypothetical protein